MPSQLDPRHVGLLTLYVFWCLAGPVGRLLTSARMYQNNLKVLIFCRLVGIVDGHIPSTGWHFFLQVLHCVKALQGDGWQGLVQVRHTTVYHSALCRYRDMPRTYLAQGFTNIEYCKIISSCMFRMVYNCSR